MNKNSSTFIACDAPYEDAALVLFGAPFDSTTSYRPGARFGSAAIRNESYSIETYSPYLDLDLEDMAVFDCGDLELPFGAPEQALEAIRTHVTQILLAGKRPVMLGGEHLVTLGAVQAMAARYTDLHILHFDAHTDLREDYLGVTLSHATVMRRCHELVGDFRIHQYGIRSGLKSEFSWAKEHIYLQKFNTSGIEKLRERVGDAPLYVSIDLDVFDPGIFPGTGTPEAGGIDFQSMMHALTIMKQCHVVGADMVELCPVYDQSGISTSLACKLLRELLLTL